jgi:hypothetical protein
VIKKNLARLSLFLRTPWTDVPRVCIPLYRSRRHSGLFKPVKRGDTFATISRHEWYLEVQGAMALDVFSSVRNLFKPEELTIDNFVFQVAASIVSPTLKNNLTIKLVSATMKAEIARDMYIMITRWKISYSLAVGQIFSGTLITFDEDDILQQLLYL